MSIVFPGSGTESLTCWWPVVHSTLEIHISNAFSDAFGLQKELLAQLVHTLIAPTANSISAATKSEISLSIAQQLAL